MLMQNGFARSGSVDEAARECLKGSYSRISEGKCTRLGIAFLTGTSNVRLDVSMGKRILNSTCDRGDKTACKMMNYGTMIKGIFSLFN